MRILYAPNNLSQQRQFEKKNVNIYPVLLSMEATKRRDDGDEIYWGETMHRVDKIIVEPQGLPFLSLPKADRMLTKALDKKYQQNGNFKHRPGTYIVSANGCWHGKCTFCVENGKPYEVRPVSDVIQEIEECKKLGFKEVFDDSGTFPIGTWLSEFLDKFSGGITLGCNMRMVDTDYSLMAHKGFRLLLFGLESANQNTLNLIQKGTHEEDVKYLYKAAKAGLDVHVAVMFGFPWETDEEAVRTLHLVHTLLRKGIAKTAQASFYSPVGGGGNSSHRKYVSKIYDVCLSPDFWFNQIKSIKNEADLKYLWRKIKTGLKEWK